MYGKDTEKWPGCPIALYVTQTEYDGEMRDCIRIRTQRPEMPAGKGGKQGRAPVRRDAPQFDVTQDQLEEAMKAKGLIDETHKERVARIEREWIDGSARTKEIAERALGRKLNGDDSDALTVAEVETVKRALAEAAQVVPRNTEDDDLDVGEGADAP
jgi:hypothetical protein